MKVYPVFKKTQTTQPSFGYSSPLKTDFKNGLIKLEKGVYGGSLKRKKNASLDHIIPKSKGGTSDIYNYFLSNKIMNMARGNRPLKDFIKLEQFLEYLSAMLEVKTKNIDGVDYCKGMIKNVLKALKEGL